MTSRPSVIIPALNAGQSFGALIAMLKTCPETGEITVMDSGSTEGTQGAVKKAGAKLLGTLSSTRRHRKKVFAADPLLCPDCGGKMRIVAFIEEQRVVRAIIEHLSLWDVPLPPPNRTRASPTTSPSLSRLRQHAPSL